MLIRTPCAHRLLACSVAWLLAIAHTPVNADTRLDYSTRSDGVTSMVRVQISSAAVRLFDSAAPDSWTLYRRDEHALYIANSRDQSYTKLTPAGIAAVADSVDRRFAELEKHRSQLPDDLTALLDARLAQRNAPPAPPPRATPTGKTPVVAGARCTAFAIGTQRLCLSMPTDLAISSDEHASLLGMAALLRQLAAAYGVRPDSLVLEGADGQIPVVIQDVDPATNVRTTRQALTAVSHSKLASDVYSVPPGYAERDAERLR